jgi:hypothetical protein
VEQSWQALHAALAGDLFTAVHLTVTGGEQSVCEQILDRLQAAGVKAVSLSASTSAARDQLLALGDYAADLQMALIYDLPVPYSAMHPVAIELAGANELPKGAGRAWLYLEPDGDVLTGQGDTRVLGNFLENTWEEIWKP